MKFDIDNLIGVGVSNKDTEKVDMILYKKVNKDFSDLKSIWSKSFFIFALERVDNKRLKYCGNKLHLELKILDSETYKRYFEPYMLDMKRAFSVTRDFQDIQTHIVNSLVEFGNTEYIILNKILYNATDLYSNMAHSLPMDMKREIETLYDQ